MEKMIYEKPVLTTYDNFGEIVVNGSGPDQGDNCTADPDGLQA